MAVKVQKLDPNVRVKYTHSNGQDAQVMGFHVPSTGLITKVPIEALDKLVTAGLLRRELVSTDGSKSPSPQLAPSIPVGHPAETTEIKYDPSQLKNMSMSELREVGYKHGIKGTSVESIIKQLGERNLLQV